MKPISLLIACLTAASATSAGISLLFANRAPLPTPAAASVSPDLWRDLATTLEQIQSQQEDLAVSVQELQMRSGSVDRVAAEGVSDTDLDAAVARYLAQASVAQDAVALDAPPELTTRGMFDQLVAGDLNQTQVEKMWMRAREEGRTDELLAMFEARAEENPSDPAMRVELGQAYLQKIQEVGQGPLAGALATQADGAFDAALAIDSEHWGARFNKAVALSFWPPIFGKQSAAIHEFETLIGQQSRGMPKPSHAQTHLLLGNLYQQLGDRDKAIKAWQTGSSLFPDYEALREQLTLAGSH
ncbi:MAG: tetratricopeptide (TPR) repeat protein [Chlamydiales bacterium]|jgi:tetratricopeptide (TPR) repeat protein